MQGKTDLCSTSSAYNIEKEGYIIRHFLLKNGRCSSNYSGQSGTRSKGKINTEGIEKTGGRENTSMNVMRSETITEPHSVCGMNHPYCFSEKWNKFSAEER